jgi:hypothetical protein
VPHLRGKRRLALRSGIKACDRQEMAVRATALSIEKGELHGHRLGFPKFLLACRRSGVHFTRNLTLGTPRAQR